MGDITSDLPIDVSTGDISFGLDEPLQRLQVMLNERNIDIDSLDERGMHGDVLMRGYEPKQLQRITNFVDEDPELKIKSSQVKDLNDYFDKNLDNSDPNFIFRDDRITRNNVGIIQQGNASYVKDRDLYVVPPPPDVQQKIFELLRSGK